MRTPKMILLTIVFLGLFFSATHRLNCVTDPNPSFLVKLNQIDSGGDYLGLYHHDGLLFGLKNEAVVIFDLSNSSSPVRIAEHKIGSRLHEMTIADGKLFALDLSYGVKVYNYFSPTNIAFLAQYPMPSGHYFVDIKVRGDYAFISDHNYGEGGVRVLNISDIHDIQEVEHFNAVLGPNNLILTEEDVIFTAGHEGGLFMINISVRDELSTIGTFYESVGVYSCLISGNYAYLSDNKDGIRVVDITKPESMEQVALYPFTGPAGKMLIQDDVLYTAKWEDGLLLVNISDPTNPTKVEELFDGGEARDLEFVNNYLYVADGLDGIEIFQTNKEQAVTTDHQTSIDHSSDAVSTANFSFDLAITILLCTVSCVYGFERRKG